MITEDRSPLWDTDKSVLKTQVSHQPGNHLHGDTMSRSLGLFIFMCNCISLTMYDSSCLWHFCWPVSQCERFLFLLSYYSSFLLPYLI